MHSFDASVGEVEGLAVDRAAGNGFPRRTKELKHWGNSFL